MLCLVFGVNSLFGLGCVSFDCLCNLSAVFVVLFNSVAILILFFCVLFVLCLLIAL